MTFFLLTVVWGFVMVDQWEQGDSNKPERYILKKNEWLFIIVVLMIFIFIWSGGLIVQQVLNFVEIGYKADGNGVAGKIFSAITSSGSLIGYKLLAFHRVVGGLRWIYLAIPFLLFGVFSYAQKQSLFTEAITLQLFFAASLWGWAVSTRTVAIAAGGIVGLYALIKFKKSALFPLVIYSLTAIIISFVVWPIVWLEGFSVYIKSFTTFSDFPYRGRVLFAGNLYLPKEVPSAYVPQYMSIGFTEPLVVLAIIGFILGVIYLFKRKTERIKIVLILLWFMLPILYIVVEHPTIYNGIRHMFFIAPPLFVLAGMAFEFLIQKLGKKTWGVLAVILVLLPGFYNLIYLHPFQAMYFNNFVGGIQGAENQYHLPYMNSAYKQAMEYLNHNAPPESSILFWKEDLFGRIFAENKYQFGAFYPDTDFDFSGYEYLVIPTSKINQTDFGQYPIAYSVMAGKVEVVRVVDLRNLGD